MAEEILGKSVQQLKKERTIAKSSFTRQANFISRGASSMLQVELKEEFIKLSDCFRKMLDANEDYRIGLEADIKTEDEDAGLDVQQEADIDKSVKEGETKLKEIRDIVQTNLWSKYGGSELPVAILEAEKANDKAADVPVESANLEGYEVHLVLLDKRIKEAISAMSTWERWIPVELKDELGGRVKDLRASYYRLELRKAEFATARTINEQGTGVKLLPQPATFTPIVRIKPTTLPIFNGTLFVRKSALNSNSVSITLAKQKKKPNTTVPISKSQPSASGVRHIIHQPLIPLPALKEPAADTSPTMSYGSIDGGSFGSRNPFGGPTRQGYQLVATQVSPAELQDVFQETSSNIFQINANVVTLEKNLQALGTSRDTAELRESLHSTQQQTNKVITNTSQLIKQLSDIISGSSRQDRLRLTRLKTELSESVQCYGDLQKKIAERSKALLPPAQTDKKKNPQTPSSEQLEEGPVFGEAAGSEGRAQAFLSEISEEDVEVLHQREAAVLQIEKDMLDVSQIMKDLASMVHEQGDAIDSIEDYIQTSSSNVESANQELAKANHYQRQLRKRKCYLLVAGGKIELATEVASPQCSCTV
ncbi:t-SNARE domain-containing protein 1 [Solea senegalensis]|uniref:t-SNARE domain-containing protein 1 n=1 Tax=Solea senegalensis TaxID=28829 RepID=A0AAV6PSI2_SOLSE|nr:t-SNARE domain-containing protein 1 [Solea senegalensis]